MTITDFHDVSGKPANAHVAIDIDVDGFWAWFTDLFARAENHDVRRDFSRHPLV